MISSIKERARYAMGMNYWGVVLASLILVIVTYTPRLRTPEIRDLQAQYPNYSQTQILALASVALLVSLIGVGIFLLLSTFFFYPLNIGCQRFFIMSLSKKTSVSEIFKGYWHNYWNKILAGFLVDIIVAAGTLLFIVPGIILALMFSQVPYVFAENPDIGWKEAMKASVDMMDGKKWDYFVLGLSFIGWILLSIVTLGLLYLFFVSPYLDLSLAEFHNGLRRPFYAPGDLSGYAQSDSYENQYSYNDNSYNANSYNDSSYNDRYM